MSSVITGKAPRTDPQWARDISHRLTQLEQSQVTRVGNWTLSDQGGSLVATQLGQAGIDLSAPESAATPVKQVIAAAGGTAGLTDALSAFLTDLEAFLGPLALGSGGPLNPITAAQALVNSILAPTGLLPIVQSGGTILASLIPGLNASQITSGVFSLAQLPASLLTTASSIAASAISGVLTTANIPGLNASQITSGVFSLSQLPNTLLTTASSIAASAISGVLTTANIPGLSASQITSGQFPQTMVNLTSVAASLINGTLTTSTVVPANIVTGALTSAVSVPANLVAGVLTSGNIPGLNTSQITSGVFPQTMVNLTSIPAGIVSGVLTSANIPGLAASQITSGQFTLAQLPGSVLTTASSIAASAISGVLTSANIPGLAASQITSGQFGLGVIPQLPIAQITSLPGQLATMFSPFNPPQVVGPGQITVDPQNLLKNSNFPDAASMAGETVWVWDAATNAAPGGSAKVNVATNTNTKALQSDPIQVAAKDNINCSAWTQWSGLTYTGTPIGLMLNLYDASNTLITQVTLATATMTGATSSWVQLAGSYTIPDASTAVWARLVYNVSTTATAGSVWFTNGSFTKPNPIPQAAVENLTGILGAADVGQTIQNFLDKGVQGIVGDLGTLTNQSLAVFNQQISNMARFLGFVTAGAAPAGSVANIASNVDTTIKARAVQKAFNDNIDPTTDAVFKLKDVWQNATLPVVASTAGATVMGDITVRDGGTKNAVTWYGYPAGGNFGSITDFRVNIWSINKTTNVRTKVHGSINLIGSATPPGTGSAPVFNSYNLPTGISNAPGDRLTAEIAILGSGTYYLVGQTISAQIPFHSVYGLHGLTRASAAAPTTMNPPGGSGSPLSYSRAIPWIGMSGVQSATQFTPVIIPYYSSGTFDPSIYGWANYIDIIVCGPGGNGMNGSGYWGGYPGGAGGWAAATLPKSAWGAVTTSVNVTAGGSQTASSITVPGWGTIYGGAGANATQVSGTSNLGAPAGGPGDEYYDGTNYPGGNGGGPPQTGGAQPGGGGAGGNAPFTVGTNIYGGRGGDGIGYIKVYQ